MTKAKANKSVKLDNPQLKGKMASFFSNNLYIILAFVVPFVLMTTAFGVMQVSPFGDKQILVTDLWHQYFPFLVDFQDKLKHGESLFWSWTQGGGVNYFALMSYYLASPLNFFSVFLPKEVLREFLMFSVVIKIACAGTFMAIFLRSVYKKNDFSLVVFGCAFSFCAFFMGYYWNTIWLDTVCITPLVVLGAVKLFTENKFRLYVITLAISLLANYYIGLFTCIFVLLAFTAYSILKMFKLRYFLYYMGAYAVLFGIYLATAFMNHPKIGLLIGLAGFVATAIIGSVRWENVRKYFSKLVQIGAYSLIGIGLTAFFLLPAFFGLQNTHASGSTFPETFAINIGGSNDLLGVLEAIKKILSNFITFIPPATKEADALPNIACGTVALVLGVVFFTNKKIGIKEKLVEGGLVLFMILSCIIRQLDYIWHGFHFTNMIPYRFSYLISFVIVVMAFRAFMLLDYSNCLQIIVSVLFVAMVILFAIGTQDQNVIENTRIPYTILGTSIIAFVICAILLLYTRRIIPKQIVLIVLAVIVIGESAATAYIGVKTTTVTGTYDYPRGEKDTATVVAFMDNLERNSNEIWRAEMTSTQTLNDGSINYYNGLSMFNSMANENMTRFFENFGMMGWKSGNRYTYAESSPVTNLFMNLKYIITRDGSYQNKYDMTDTFTRGYIKLLKNNHYLSMGYMVDEDLLNWKENDNEGQFNPFDRQNEFFKRATGIEKPVYTALYSDGSEHTDEKDFPVTSGEYGHYSYRCENASITPHVKWNYTAAEDGLYCIYADIDGGDDVSVMINDVAQTSKYNMARPYIACIGEYKKGTKISVYADLSAGQTGNAKVYVNKLNSDVFEQGYNMFKESVMETTKSSGNYIEGTINVKKDGLLYTSIPYEEGWTAVVDGKEAEITPVGDALVALKLKKGTHSISFKYYPKGFWLGFAVTCMCMLTFIFMCVYIYIIKKRRCSGEIQIETMPFEELENSEAQKVSIPSETVDEQTDT